MISTFGGRCLTTLLLLLMCSACGEVWNDPNPRADQGRRVLHEFFNSRPKHLDPAQSYTEDEGWIVSTVYESLYEYHYLKRPYTLQPALAAAMPQIRYRDANGNPLPADAPAEQIAETVYEIPIRRGVSFQPHPALARDESGAPRYADFDASGMGVRDQIGDFAYTGTREINSADFAYQFKRLARPGIQVPVFPVYRKIVGMDALAQRLRDDAAAGKIDPQGWVDMREYPLEGVETPDPYTLRIRISGKFPQFIYWLAITFVTPVPWEAERFYALPGMAAQEFSLDMWPVGTGAFMMTRNRPLREMVLARNPEFREDTYPCEGEPGDTEAGLLDACGERLPLVDEVRFSYEREATPFWNKFLQGYYDFYASNRWATMDGFDSALQLQGGDLSLTPQMSANGIELRTELEPSLEYFFLNMLDPVLGNTGATAEERERARKLRRAINLAVDVEEYIGIILNGLGLPIQGPLPRGMAGVRDGADGINPYIYTWANGRPQRRDLGEARRLLAEAGYPGGRDAVTGKPLLIYFDGYDSFTRARLELLIKQLARIDIQLVPRLTEWNRFQEKIRRGNWQMSFWGWNADYPDPENFLLQYYGPNSKVRAHGENFTNFSDPEFDRLYEQFQFLDLDADRQPPIDAMVEILRRESPLAGGWQREAFVLNHSWLGNAKPGKIARVYRKYYAVDPQVRAERQLAWNRPRLGALFGLGVLLLALAVLAVRHYRRHERERGLVAGRPA